MKYEYIIWDWNGTLLNDVDVNFEILNILLKRRSLPEFGGKEKYLDMFGFPIIDFYEKAGFDLVGERFEDIAREYSHLYDELFPTVELYEKAEEVLRFFFNAGVNQVIVSASQQRLLTHQVTLHGIDHYFDDILGMRDIYGKGKVSIARYWMAQKGLMGRQVLFIGDTLHDKEVADSIGCDCILVADGHNSKERLVSSGATVVDSIDEIIQLVK